MFGMNGEGTRAVEAALAVGRVFFLPKKWLKTEVEGLSDTLLLRGKRVEGGEKSFTASAATEEMVW